MAHAINLTHTCQALRCLPRAGGLYDQDPYDVLVMQMVLSAQIKKAEMEEEKAKSERMIKGGARS